MDILTKDKLYLNSILLGVKMNFSPFCGKERTEEVYGFLQRVFMKLEQYENSGVLPDQGKTHVMGQGAV